MARYQGWFAFVLALAIAAGMFLLRTPLELGLDLRGGSQLTVQVQPAGDITRVGSEEMEAVKAVLERRVNGLGVAESTLQTVGEYPVGASTPRRTGSNASGKGAWQYGDVGVPCAKVRCGGRSQKFASVAIASPRHFAVARGTSS